MGRHGRPRPARRVAASALALGAALLLVVGCEEMRRPPPGSWVPPTLAAGSPDPVRDAAMGAAAAFANGGRDLVGRPAETARGAAQLEVITVEFMRDPRWAPLPPNVTFELRSAAVELRSALGVRPEAQPEAVVRALANAARALELGDRGAAAAALPPSLFVPGGQGTLERLEAPGPLPQAQIAASLAGQEVARLERDRRWGLTGALDPSGRVEATPGMRTPGGAAF